MSFLGQSHGLNITPSPTVPVDISAVPVGAFMVLTVFGLFSYMSPLPVGWTNLSGGTPNPPAFGFWKNKTSSDPAVVYFTPQYAGWGPYDYHLSWWTGGSFGVWLQPPNQFSSPTSTIPGSGMWSADWDAVFYATASGGPPTFTPSGVYMDSMSRSDNNQSTNWLINRYSGHATDSTPVFTLTEHDPFNASAANGYVLMIYAPPSPPAPTNWVPASSGGPKNCNPTIGIVDGVSKGQPYAQIEPDIGPRGFLDQCRVACLNATTAVVLFIASTDTVQGHKASLVTRDQVTNVLTPGPPVTLALDTGHQMGDVLAVDATHAVTGSVDYGATTSTLNICLLKVAGGTLSVVDTRTVTIPTPQHAGCRGAALSNGKFVFVFETGDVWCGGVSGDSLVNWVGSTLPPRPGPHFTRTAPGDFAFVCPVDSNRFLIFHYPLDSSGTPVPQVGTANGDSSITWGPSQPWQGDRQQGIPDRKAYWWGDPYWDEIGDLCYLADGQLLLLYSAGNASNRPVQQQPFGCYGSSFVDNYGHHVGAGDPQYRAVLLNIDGTGNVTHSPPHIVDGLPRYSQSAPTATWLSSGKALLSWNNFYRGEGDTYYRGGAQQAVVSLSSSSTSGLSQQCYADAGFFTEYDFFSRDIEMWPGTNLAFVAMLGGALYDSLAPHSDTGSISTSHVNTRWNYNSTLGQTAPPAAAEVGSYDRYGIVMLSFIPLESCCPPTVLVAQTLPGRLWKDRR